mgnify:CR=1 FL=1
MSEFSVIYGFFTYTPMSNNETLGIVCFVIYPSLSNITCVLDKHTFYQVLSQRINAFRSHVQFDNIAPTTINYTNCQVVYFCISCLSPSTQLLFVVK